MHLRLLAIAALASCTVALARADYACKEPFAKSAPFSATGTLSLENVNGAVDIRTWDKNEIWVEGEKSAATAEELKEIELTIDLTGTDARVKAKLPHAGHGWWNGHGIRGSVRFVVTLPATASIRKLAVVNSNVTLTGVRGAVHADCVNGSLNASGMSADAELKTVNGPIVAEFASVGGNQHLAFNSVNGSIKLKLPAQAGADVHAVTVNGRISSDFPLTAHGFFVGRKVEGTIGSGGASLSANTVNGPISIERL